MILLLGRCGYERVAELLREEGVEVAVGAWTQVELVQRLQPELVFVDLFEHQVVWPWLRGKRGDLGPLHAVVQALQGQPVIYRGLRRPMAGTWGLLEAGPDLSELEEVVAGQRVLDVQGLWARKGLPTDDVLYGSGHGEAGHVGVELEARWIATLLRAQRSPGCKVLVCDLDDTLIHGQIVASDFAARNPSYGSVGSAEEAFWRLPRGLHEAVREVQRRGVVLALCTRNHPEVVRERLRRRADDPYELALELDDFTVVEAGYGTKSQALRRIADKLGVGLDSLAFLDDSAFENEEVAAHAPQVQLVPRPWRESLLLGPLFASSGPPVDRRASYASRVALVEQDPQGLEDFLRGLELKVQVRAALPGDLPRVRQLFQRVHQLDLTGERPELNDVEGLYVGFVRDRLADHGLVCAGFFRGRRLVSWVCSCRVLPHRVAASLLWAMRQEQPQARVERTETPRNGATMGLIEESEGGLAEWVERV